MPILIILMLQTARQRQMDDTFQSGFIFGYFIGGLILTRIVSWLIRFILVKTVLRGLYVVSALIAHVATFIICAVGLWLMLSTPRETFTDYASGNTYRQSSEYPVEMLIIYGVCIVIWLGVDLVLARRAENKALEREAQASQSS
jgi:fructose-specific phosphotransferase system IIC component